MINSIKHNGKSTSVSGGLALSAFVSIGLTLTLVLLLANLLNTEKMNWTQAGYWIMGMLFAASFIGGKIAIAAVKRQRLVVSLMSGTIYWAFLLSITALFFGGNYSSIWETAGIILAGCGTAAMIAIPARTRNKKRTTAGSR